MSSITLSLLSLPQEDLDDRLNTINGKWADAITEANGNASAVVEAYSASRLGIEAGVIAANIEGAWEKYQEIEASLRTSVAEPGNGAPRVYLMELISAERRLSGYVDSAKKLQVPQS